MKCQVKILDIETLREIPGYWTEADYINLLDAFNYPDAQNSNPAELWDLLEMAISDFEPHEATEIMLRYKLSEVLNEGQIDNMSYEMSEDSDARENSNIALHYPLYAINQLLHKAYNGTFPNVKATELKVELHVKGEDEMEVSKDLVLMALSAGLSDRNLIKRLFEDPLKGEVAFPDAEHILWELHEEAPHQYRVITSDHWLNKEDIVAGEFTAEFELYEEEED